MNVAALLAEHGSPLWLVDLDRVRERWRGFRDAFDVCWPDVVALDDARWTLCARRETLEDLLAADAEAVLTAVGSPAGHEEEQP